MKTFIEILNQINENNGGNPYLPKNPNKLRILTQTDHAHSVNFFNRLTIPLNYIHRSLKGQANMALLVGNMAKYDNMSGQLAHHHPGYSDNHMGEVKTVRNLIRGQIRSHPILVRKISQLPTFRGRPSEDIGGHIDSLIRQTEKSAHDDVRKTLIDNPGATIIPPFSKNQSLRDHLLDYLQSHK